MFGYFNEEAQALWDFVRCQREDGTFYGSPTGNCKKGKPVGDDEGKPGDKVAKRRASRAARRERQKESAPAPAPAGQTSGSGRHKEVIDEIKKEVGASFDAAHEKIFEDRYAKAKTVKELGTIHRRAIKDLDNDDLDAKEGVLKAMKKAMGSYLEANMASGQGAKRAAELAAMSPEERRRAETREAIERGIRNKVVSGRR